MPASLAYFNISVWALSPPGALWLALCHTVMYTCHITCVFPLS
jgi:hypothetical protein